MAKTVAEILNEGITKLGLQGINENFINIIGEFYRSCYPNDELKGMPGSKEKYNRSFYCYNLSRMKGNLDVSIDDDGLINISQSNYNEIRNAVMSVGTLALEEISGMNYGSNISSATKELLLSQTGGQITIKKQYNNGESESNTNKFLYDKTCKTLNYTSNTGTYVDSAESIEKAHEIVYGFFKRK